jgi:hypothetical protein
MRVYLSWSGNASREMARVLRDQCNLALRPVEFWVSDADLEPGTDWFREIISRFDAADVAVLCLTRSNLTSPWIHFEAGLLTRQLGRGRLIPYLLDFGEAQLKDPLSRFQAVRADHDGTLKLFRTVNEIFDYPKLAPQDLDRMFDAFWPKLEAGFKQAIADQSLKSPSRTDTDLLEEILKHVRALALRPAGDRARRAVSGPTVTNLARPSEAKLFDSLYNECQESVRDAWESSPDEPREVEQAVLSEIETLMQQRVEQMGLTPQWQRWWAGRFTRVTSRSE